MSFSFVLSKKEDERQISLVGDLERKDAPEQKGILCLAHNLP